MVCNNDTLLKPKFQSTKILLCMLCSNQDPITPPLFDSKRMSVTIHQQDTKVCSDTCNRNKTYKPRKEFNAVCLKKRAELQRAMKYIAVK